MQILHKHVSFKDYNTESQWRCWLIANNELCWECHQSWLSLPTTPGLPQPCLGPRTPFRSDPGVPPPACAGAVQCCGLGQLWLWDSALLSPGSPCCSPHPSPREPAVPCCTMTRTMKNHSSKKDVKRRNATNTPENLPYCFLISTQFYFSKLSSSSNFKRKSQEVSHLAPQVLKKIRGEPLVRCSPDNSDQATLPWATACNHGPPAETLCMRAAEPQTGHVLQSKFSLS